VVWVRQLEKVVVDPWVQERVSLSERVLEDPSEEEEKLAHPWVEDSSPMVLLLQSIQTVKT
jgi:hypothetical protein